MEAVIMLFVSVFMLSVYSFIYVSFLLTKKAIHRNENMQLKKQCVVLFFVIVLSGSSSAYLLLT